MPILCVLGALGVVWLGAVVIKSRRPAKLTPSDAMAVHVDKGIVSAMDDAAVVAAVNALAPTDRDAVKALAERCKAQACPVFATVGAMVDYAKTHPVAPERPASWDGPTAKTGPWSDDDGAHACRVQIDVRTPGGAKYPLSESTRVIPVSGRPEERLAKGPVRVKNAAGEWESKAFDCAFDPVKREVLRYSVY